MSSTIASRTRISAVVSCRRTRTVLRRTECSTPASASPAAAASSTNRPSSVKVAPTLAAISENSNDNSTMAPKSATDAPAIVICPTG